MPIPTPEDFLKDRFLHELPKEKILNNFHCEMRWLNEYGKLIIADKDRELNKVIAKVNFLMRASLRMDIKAISEFLVDYGKVNEGDIFGIDFQKILSDGK